MFKNKSCVLLQDLTTWKIWEDVSALVEDTQIMLNLLTG